MYGLTVRKPSRHHDMEVWQRNNDKLLSATNQGREYASGLRQSSQQLRSEAQNNIHWKRKDTNVKLTDRIINIERCYLQLDHALKQTEEEIISVNEAKKAIENAHTTKFPFNMACKRCVDMREARRDVELVDDFVNKALAEESHSLDQASQQLREKGTELWNNLCSLKEIQDALKNDLKIKRTANNEDRYLRELNLHSKDITLKHLPLDIPSSVVTDVQWAESGQSKKQDAEKVVRHSQELVCGAHSLIRHTDNNVLQHREKTLESMRRRIHQVQSARDLLENQKDQLLQELPKLHNEATELEKALQSTRAPLKLVHTRLENRKWYSPTEICSDGPRKALGEELEQIESFRTGLVQKLQAARLHLNELQMQVTRVDQDLKTKDQVLEIENKTLEIHSHPCIGDQDFQWVQPESFVVDLYSKSDVSTAPSETANPETFYREGLGTRRNKHKLRDTLTIGMRRSSAPSIKPIEDQKTLVPYASPSFVLPDIKERSVASLILPDVVPTPFHSTLSEKSDLLTFEKPTVKASSSETFLKEHFDSALQIFE